jgi:hypothetical protein
MISLAYGELFVFNGQASILRSVSVGCLCNGRGVAPYQLHGFLFPTEFYIPSSFDHKRPEMVSKSVAPLELAILTNCGLR